MKWPFYRLCPSGLSPASALAHCLAARQWAQTVVSADQRARGAVGEPVMGGAGLRPALADRNDVALQQERVGDQSPRLWFWGNRLKLLLIVSVAYAFLLSLLELPEGVLYDCLLCQWCHRTGRWVDAVQLSLYRLRSVLSQLWQTYPPNLPAPGHVAALLYPLLNSG